jgi:hypothetical protein
VARAAGNSEFYELAVLNGAGQPTGRSIFLPSVTSILKALPKWGLDWYGYKMGLLQGRELAADQARDYHDTNTWPDDAFYDEVKKLGREGKAKTPTSELKGAADRGTSIHDMAEKLAKDLFSTGQMPKKASIRSDLTGYAEALWKFYNERVKDKLEVVHVEVTVVSLSNQYAGTLDLILHNPKSGEFYIIDWKTSKAIYESHLLQITAYEHAAREQEWIPRDAASYATVVRLGADGNYEMQTSELELADFMHVYRVWQMLRALKGE